MLVAWFMAALGETLAVARLPGVIAGAGLVTAVFIWLGRKSGPVAAWTGALLLCFQDMSILLSAEVRFYTLHALCLWLAAAIVYQVTESEPRRRQPLWMLGIAAALSVAALDVQVTAGVALAGLAAWVSCDFAYRFRVPLWRLLRSHPIMAAMVGAIVLGGTLGILLHPPAVLTRLLADFRQTAYWAQPLQDWVIFYQQYYSQTIPLLWGLFPLAFVAALIHRPRAAIFCAFLFVVPTLIMSFGAQKQGRYAFFALPYLFATWGLAAQAVFPNAVEIGYQAWGRLSNLVLGRHSSPMAVGEQRLRRRTFAAVAFLILSFAVVNQPSYWESAKIIVKSALAVLLRPTQLWAGPASEPWASHRSELAEMVKRASIFIASVPSTTLYELGPFDAVLSRSPPDESLAEGEFALDRRVGRPNISTAESLRAIMNCYPTGIVIVPRQAWRNKAGVTDDVANLLVATSRLTTFRAPELPEDDLLVFEWHGQPQATSLECDEVRSKLTQTS
ncbi:MAG TPA: hypothetical protein VFZ03_02795 [Dongiaceae bacterium]